MGITLQRSSPVVLLRSSTGSVILKQSSSARLLVATVATVVGESPLIIRSDASADVIVDALTDVLRLTAALGGQIATLPLVATVTDGHAIDIRDAGYGALLAPHAIVPTGSDKISDQTRDDGSLAIDQNGGSMRLRAIHATSTWERFG